MNRPLRTLFLDLVRLASALPLAACASTVVPNDGASQPDAQTIDGGSCHPHTMGPGTGCALTEVWPCGTPVTIPTLSVQSGAVCDTLCPDFLGQSLYSHNCEATAPDATGAVSVNCAFCRTGRRPDGWTLTPGTSSETPLGEFFARLAELEAASIPAFRTLVSDLELHGAPARLTDLARSAIRDEREHTRLMGSIAKRFGATPRVPMVKRRGATSLEEVAVQNAVEGCVGETFGALVATFQAQHADDAEVRLAMARIAEDETRHADLAREVAAWADGLLDAAARERVMAARNRALETLREEVAVELHADLRATAGMPNARQARLMLEGLAALV